MSLRRPRFAEEESAETINISPLIDVIFILLIFFIVTMAFADGAALKVEVPKSRTAEKTDSSVVTLVLDADSGVSLDGTRRSVRELEPLLRERLAQGGRLVIRSDSRVNVERLVEIMDCGKLCGAREIYVAAERKGKR